MAFRSAKEFKALLQYYIACLAKEDALTLTFDASGEGTRYWMIAREPPTLDDELTLPLDEKLTRFFSRSHGTKQLFIATPVLIDRENLRLPVFMKEFDVEVSPTEVHITPRSTSFSMNPAVLCTTGVSLEEATQIRTDLEMLPFDQACTSLTTLLQKPTTETAEHKTNRPRLTQTTMVFFGDRTGMTTSLIRELHMLADRPFDDLSHTALYSLLTDDIPTTPIAQHPTLLEVFLMNPSQQQAVAHALTQPVTLITGPPGTGKSQVVLNIIANAIHQRKTVLFASKNNKAVDVVIDKLNAILPRPLAIRMGHRAIRQKTAETCKTLLTNLPAPPDTTIIRKDYKDASNTLTQIRTTLEEIATINTHLDDTYHRIDTTITELPETLATHWQEILTQPADLAQLETDLQRYFPDPGQPWRPRPWKKTHQKTCYHHHLTHLPTTLQASYLTVHEETPTAMKSTLRHYAAIQHLHHDTHHIHDLTTRLHHLPPVPTLLKDALTIQKQRQTLSRTLLAEHWLRRLHTDPHTNQQHLNAFFEYMTQLEHKAHDPDDHATLSRMATKSFRHILSSLPVWVVTNLSAKRSFPFENNLFDLLIIDEASQCDIPSALPLLYRAKHTIIIGDPNQLNHVSLLNHSEDRRLATQHHATDLYDQYSYTRHSLYEFYANTLNKNTTKPLLLNEHYRCHPHIITYSNTYYYDHQLTIATTHHTFLTLPTHPHHLTWHHTTGHTTPAASPYNEPEADACIHHLTTLTQYLKERHTTLPSIGVVTLFRAQADLITEKITATPALQNLQITVGTAHRFQGDERDIILLSPGISTGAKPGTLYWVWTTRQLINVAVSRARSHCLIVGDATACTKTPGPLADLHHYATTLTQPPPNTHIPHTQALLQALQQSGLPFLPPPPTLPCACDLTLTLNGHRYAIIFSTTPTLNQALHQENITLRAHGWRPRRYQLNTDTDVTQILEDLQRLY
jgi:hypothetical protein